MVQIVLMGLGAGVAAALSFESVASGSMILALSLFYLAPLPILIVGLGWSHWAALVAGAVAAVLLVTQSAVVSLAFLVGVALPAWWLAYLALLARPSGDGREWYPAGRLVLWAAATSALTVGAALLSIGTDAASLHQTLHNAFETLIAGFAGEFEKPEDAARLIDLMVAVVPAAAGASMLIITVVNLWLAGRIVRISGRLARPWPSLPGMRFPTLAPAALGAAIAGAFLPDLAGIASSALAAALMMAHVLLGLSVIHALTAGLAARGLILGSLYAAILLFGRPVSWPLLLIGLLGIAEALFDVRGLIARRRGPPAAPS
jgi:hypothetical protein